MPRLHFHSILLIALLLLLLSACEPAVPLFPRFTPTADPVALVVSQPTPTDTPTPALPTATPVPTSSLDVAPEDLADLQLSFWHNWSGPSLGILHGLVDEFNQSNEWGINIQASYQGNLDELVASAEAAFQDGNPPDLLVANLPQAVAWEQRHGLTDLQAFVNDPLWGMPAQEQADFYPVFWEQDIYQGKRLGLPAQRFASLLYYNQDWARQLGFASAPTTPDEFRQQACAAAQTKRQDDILTNDASGGWIISTHHPAILGWIYAYGGEIMQPPDDQAAGDAYNFDTNQVRSAFTFLRDLYDRGCAWLAENNPPEAEFAGREGLFAADSLIGLPYQAYAFETQGNDDDWTVLPFLSPDGNPAITVYGPSFVVPDSSPERQLAAWLFLKWLLQPENEARLTAATGSFPLRTSTLDYMQDYAAANPRWAAAVDLLPLAHPEPALPSWDLVRWAVGDAATQLFRDYFTIDRVPDLARLLDQTADDLSVSPLEDRFLKGGSSIEVTASPVTPSPTP
jgi:ABC-type glycerol-3-phosphate transport system substrate-binding protein